MCVHACEFIRVSSCGCGCLGFRTLVRTKGGRERASSHVGIRVGVIKLMRACVFESVTA